MCKQKIQSDVVMTTLILCV